MTPDAFVSKWTGVTLKERSSAQEHFLDLCHLLDEPTPAEADPTGDWFCFEKGASKAGGGDGWADVWRRGCFAWEYKGPGKNLLSAFKQLQLYTPALEYPPLLIVSDVHTIEIHTAFTGLVPVVQVLALEDLRDHAKRRLLKWAFTEPEKLRPAKTTAALTEQAAARFAELAHTWRARGHAAEAVAHFSQQLLFCLFAEDIDLLPGRLFSRLLHAGQQNPAHLESMLGTLFGTMAQGGLMGVDPIDWFNGGLFSSDATLPLEPPDVALLLELARLDWSAIDPTIVGTLFERGLDPGKRTQLGAHYTDPTAIMRLVDPVVLQPLRDDWSALKARIGAQLDKAAQVRSASARTKASNAALSLLQGFLDRLRRFRVLDPACGSGNFLLLALLGLKDLEHQVIVEAEAMGLPRAFPMIGPENVLGIELNPFAAELARVVVWIGEIQWMLAHGFNLSRDPILKPLETIENRDAVLNDDGSEPAWPEADAIVGNPPFLGGSKKRSALGDAYFEGLAAVYEGRVPAGADLVTYWFEKARSQIEAGKARAAGLVATNSIRGGSNRKVLQRITETGDIFNAWSDEPWINEGAAVRVSLISFGRMGDRPAARLDGQPVTAVHADLTAMVFGAEKLAADLTHAKRLAENKGACIRGLAKVGRFDIPGDLARQWLKQPNPNGCSNIDVLTPWVNGMDVTRRPSDTWLVDYGNQFSQADAALYEKPFQYVLKHVKSERERQRDQKRKLYWWRLGRSGAEIRTALAPLFRYIATPMVAKYRLFVWLDRCIFSDQQLIVIARADDTTFGILHSRFHELWSLRMGTSLEDRPRYTPTTTFETFPFPEGLTPTETAGSTETLPSGVIIPSVEPAIRARAEPIAEAAHRLDSLRRTWLNPPEWVDIVPEVVPGYPDRIIPKPEHEQALKKRTLTNLYNERPAWLDQAHKALDAAVAAAYGWADYSAERPDDEILSRLLALNLERANTTAA